MHSLVISGGGREHAVAAALARSPQVARIIVAPAPAARQSIAGFRTNRTILCISITRRASRRTEKLGGNEIVSVLRL